MGKNNRYSDEMPTKDAVEFKDTRLPSPQEIAKAIKLGKQKITINVDNDTIIAFKELAEKNGIKYQTLMREVLKSYIDKNSDKEAS